MRGTSFSIAAVTMFSAPTMFVWTASNGLYSHAGTCLSAAAWMIRSTPRVARMSARAVADVADEEPDPVLVLVADGASPTA